MIDKVQKIREEVKKLKSQLLRGACSSQIAMETICKEEAYNEVLSILDTMQEEPVSIWHEASKKYPLTGKEIIVLRDDKIYYGKYIGGFHRYVIAEIQLTDDTAQAYAIIDYLTKKDKWIYVEDLINLFNVKRTVKNWKEEPVKRTPADIEAAMQEVEEKSRVFTEAHKGEDTDTILAQMRGKEPINEDLEEAAEKYAYELFPSVGVANTETELAFKAGAKWQKKQDQSTIELAEDHAILAGMEKMKEQMMAKAIDSRVYIDAGGYPYIPQLELYDYDKDVPLAKAGDKYKVVLIKED